MRLTKTLFITFSLLSTLLFAREQVNINFNNLQINSFIKMVAKITSTNILVTNKINGSVDLITNAPIYDDELVGILVSVLESKGYTLIKNGSIYEVIRSTEAAKHNVPVVRSGYIARGHTMVTQAIQIKGENVDIVAAKVRYLISKTAKLMTMKESNTLLITDYPKNIQTIKRIIKDIDTKNDKVIKVVAIKHADLKMIKTQLTEVAKAIFNEKVAFQKVSVMLNADINSIILIGNEKEVEQLAKVVVKLDNEQNLNEVVQIIPLKNSDAKNVLKTLNEIVTKQTFTDPTLKPNVSASEEINAIIIVGNPGVLKGLKKIIETLDKEKYQVYVQARIVEINNNDAEKIGLKYSLSGIANTSSGLLAFSGNFGGSSGIVEQAIDLIGITNVKSSLAIGASLDFLQVKGASKTVSSPSILCVNNQESSIYVGKTLSFQTGNAATAGVATNSFKREDVGLTLKIKPRVSSSDKVTLDAETILENILPTVDTNGQPVTTKQTVLTQAILRHGESIIIGGLVKNYMATTETKVPILGSIPLIGWFFTHNDTQEQQDNLIVILTPYIIDKSEKLSSLQRELGELSRLQREYNTRVFERIEQVADQAEKDKNLSKAKRVEDKK